MRLLNKSNEKVNVIMQFPLGKLVKIRKPPRGKNRIKECEALRKVLSSRRRFSTPFAAAELQCCTGGCLCKQGCVWGVELLYPPVRVRLSGFSA